MARKIHKNFTLDKSVISEVEKQAKKENRSNSFIVNRILKLFYESKPKEESQD